MFRIPSAGVAFQVELSAWLAAALAAGVETTESSPAPSAVTAASAMRLRSVFVDIIFLSLVSCGNFPKLARRSVKIF
jgi:hypothetical protein